MKLDQFPQAIASVERHLLNVNKKIRQCQAEVDNLTAAIDSSIAHDSDLKNDIQRKVKRSELMADELYQECLKELQYQQDNRAAVEIELNLLRSQFAVAKLQLRESIALRELQLSDVA